MRTVETRDVVHTHTADIVEQRTIWVFRVLSNSLDSEFCARALEEALRQGKPEIFNTDQGSQFTSDDFMSRLLDSAIRIGRGSRGRALDNIFIERLWRT